MSTTNPNAEGEHSPITPKKGKPTRSRKEAEAARKRPLVPEDRKEARRLSKQKARSQSNREHHALVTGDEENYPLQHRGPDRRLVRDIVDSRRNVAEHFLPFALVAMLFPFLLQIIAPARFELVTLAFLVALWGGIFIVVIDLFLLRRKIRRTLEERFGVVPSGMVSYGILRATNIRPWRMPKPKIKHGEAPRR
ncbi:MAG: DUF3043 domain-containing protein [Dermabacter sp.]|nr:DUF3043 domain-containing protein [Dermabacter sp.]